MSQRHSGPERRSRRLLSRCQAQAGCGVSPPSRVFGFKWLRVSISMLAWLRASKAPRFDLHRLRPWIYGTSVSLPDAAAGGMRVGSFRFTPSLSS